MGGPCSRKVKKTMRRLTAVRLSAPGGGFRRVRQLQGDARAAGACEPPPTFNSRGVVSAAAAAPSVGDTAGGDHVTAAAAGTVVVRGELLSLVSYCCRRLPSSWAGWLGG